MQAKHKTLIIIPARYGSSRFPGKPLHNIAGKTMLQRVCETAQRAAQKLPAVEVLVATDDDRILKHAQQIGVPAVITPTNCQSGSDRILAAIDQLTVKPTRVINLQGDTPLTPELILNLLLERLDTVKDNYIVTPVVQLTWAQLDLLRASKQSNPFSGTTAVISDQDEALWFSKQIIPALRDEEQLRANQALSPVFQHLGIYGYTLDMLQTFTKLMPGIYESLEGLEQLRFLEHGHKIHTIQVTLPDLNAWRGVDTLADAEFVRSIIEQSDQAI